MTKSEYQEYLKSSKWQLKRQAMLDCKSVCERCSFPYELDVHHKTYENLGHEGPADLQVLCRSCHNREHISEVEAQWSNVDINSLRARIEERIKESQEKNIDRFYELQKNKERDEEF